MTYDDIRAALDRAAATDPQLRSLTKKIRAGKATFTDTAAYSQRLSALLGQVFSAEVEAMSPEEREAICKALLRGHYDEINRILAEVQETLDEAQGFSLTPQRAPYPAERVQQLAHSLQDATVPPETIRRRADTGAANVAHAMHDDYIDVNAKLRNDLGLKCYLTRVVGSTSCKWCANLAGRFEYGRQPADIFRRHDNCTCTVTYENGRERQDVWSKRSWEASPAEIMRSAARPTVNSQEDARKLEESAVSGLTLAGKRDIMESELGRFRERLQTDESMDKLYYDTIKTRFSHGSDDAKKAFNKFVPADSIADSAFIGTPHYDPKTKKISMDYLADQQNARGEGATWFHEHAHLIDEAAGNLSSDTAFYEALFKDKSAYTRSIIRERGTRSVSETYSVLENELSDFRSQSGVSDIFNGLSNGIIQGCGVHPTSYWTKETVVQEAFAHMYEAQFDSVRYAQMKHYFPTALKRFEELLGGAVK